MSSSPQSEFLAHVRTAIESGTFRRLVLGKPRAGQNLLKATAETVRTGKGLRLQWQLQYRNKHLTQPTDLAGILAEFETRLGPDLGSAHLFTRDALWQFELNKKGEPRLTRARVPGAGREIEPAPHDRVKQRALDAADAPWLRPLGIAGEDGRVRADMSAKFRQISRYIELLLPLAREAGLDQREALRGCDMGSGKGYLTFAAWHAFAKELGRPAAITGVEARQELVDLCNRTARECGCDGLDFAAGQIVDFPLSSCDVLIALHACDTATDEALFRGIRAGAALIVAAPCCHKEVRPQLQGPDALAALTRHGIFSERLAEMVTDALRALLLETQGYRVKAFEFISPEHTPRNTMLAAVKRAQPDPASDQRAVAEYAALKAKFGIQHQRLEELLAQNA